MADAQGASSEVGSEMLQSPATTLAEAMRQAIATRAVLGLAVDLWRARQLADDVIADLRGCFMAPLQAPPCAAAGVHTSHQAEALALTVGRAGREPAPFCAGPVHQAASDWGVSVVDADARLAARGSCS